MAVYLKWQNRVQGDGIRVYRSLAPIDVTNPPTPLATLAANATSYEDESGGGNYYYAVSAYKGAAEKFAIIDGVGAPGFIFTSTKLSNLKGAWGTIQRVEGYAGPAIKVKDQAGVGPDVDIYFDAGGFVTDPAPYADTRVIRIYDQLGGGHDLVPYVGGTGNLPLYLIDASRWKTAAIDFRTSGSDMFLDEAGASAAHPYCIQDPYLCTSFQGISSSGFRAVCGVHRSTTSYGSWYSYGFWQDHTNGGLHWSIDGQAGQDATGADDTSATEDKYSVVMRVSSGSANLYLNSSNVGSDSYSAPISYLSTGAFMLNGIGANVNRNCGPWIEAFVLSGADAPPTPVATLTGYLHEARA